MNLRPHRRVANFGRIQYLLSSGVTYGARGACSVVDRAAAGTRSAAAARHVRVRAGTGRRLGGGRPARAGPPPEDRLKGSPGADRAGLPALRLSGGDPALGLLRVRVEVAAAAAAARAGGERPPRPSTALLPSSSGR